MVNHPLVSVMMPAYNAEKYIGTAIESVLAQTYENWELIIVDDGSTDNTYEVATKYKDQRIKVVKHLVNLGEGPSRNDALRFSKGDWITGLDADDAWLPNRLQRLVEVALTTENVFVADLFTICSDRNGQMVPEKVATLPWLVRKGHTATVTLREYLRAGTPGMQQLFPRKVVVERGLRFANFRFGADLDFRIQLFKAGLKLKLIGESYYLYRVWPGSVSRKVHPDIFLLYEKWLSSNLISSTERKYLTRLKAREKVRFNCDPLVDDLVNLRLLDAVRDVVAEPSMLMVLVKYLPTVVAYRLCRYAMLLRR